MRFRYAKKRRSSTSNSLAVWSWPKFLEVVLPLQEFDGMCEFENFESIRASLKHDADGWTLTCEGTTQHLEHANVLPWLEGFFFHR